MVEGHKVVKLRKEIKIFLPPNRAMMLHANYDSIVSTNLTLKPTFQLLYSYKSNILPLFKISIYQNVRLILISTKQCLLLNNWS